MAVSSYWLGQTSSYIFRMTRAWLLCICLSGGIGVVVATFCVSGPCFNNGTCTDNSSSVLGYSCSCTPCFTGDNCSAPVNVCTTTTCKHGVCLATCNNNAPSTYCPCLQGYQGQFCENNLNECDAKDAVNQYSCTGVNLPSWCTTPPCRNNGTCVNTDGSYNCICTGTGYNGSDCSVDVDECAVNGSAACAYHGNCSNTIGSYNCSCSTGYLQPHCSEASCSLVSCQNGGNCSVGLVNGKSVNWTCTCPSNYYGVDCSQDVDECTVYGSKACGYHGSCNNTIGSYNCSCSLGYQQPHCWEANCSLVNCQNGGSCRVGIGNANWTCNCELNYYGALCETAGPCVASPCQNGGTCSQFAVAPLNVTYSCSCPRGWKGVNCSVDIDECDSTISPPTCAHNSTCNNTAGSYNCTCVSGYNGRNCTDDIDECKLAEPACSNGGQCNNTDGSFSCNCTGTGYKDGTCSTDINECNATDSPCSHGNCSNLPGSFNCTCFAPAYFGSLCQYFNQCSNASVCNGGMCSPSSVGEAQCNCTGTGFIGATCGFSNLCLNNFCSNNGMCSYTWQASTAGLTPAFNCSCPVGWLGTNCSVRDPCNSVSTTVASVTSNSSVAVATGTQSSYCRNNGTCSAVVNSDWTTNVTCSCTSNDYDPQTLCLPRAAQVPAAETASPNQALYIAAPVVGGVALIVIIAVIVLCCMAKQKRATWGAYSPSRQEMSGSRVELGNVLKPPPEERLI